MANNELPTGELVNITFQVTPVDVNITYQEMIAIHNNIAAAIMQIVTNDQLGVLAWTEVSGNQGWRNAA
jgi:hypothetical protein